MMASGTEAIERRGLDCAETTDFVVVGLGGAGLAAAIEARAAGLEVLALDRASGPGGSTAAAGGYLYLGGGTALQRAVGVEDSVEAMHDYLVATSHEPEADKIARYCEGSVAHFDWLVAQGVPFRPTLYAQKHFEHPTDDGLAWTGNETLWPYAGIARPAPRGHRAQAAPGTGGALLVERLAARAAALGVAIRGDHRVTGLLLDQGRVAGVRARHFGVDVDIAARRGVLLATGGFGMNRALVETLCPALAEPGIQIIGSPYSDGAGIALGQSAGAALARMDSFFATSPLYPPVALLSGILVNRDGVRFVAEDGYHGRTTGAILAQPGRRAWLICDARGFERPPMGQALVDAWEDWGEMGRDLGLPGDSLRHAVERYNYAARAGHDRDFHKAAAYLRPIEEAPFAAIDFTPGDAPFPAFTLGGLLTDRDARVLDGAGDVIAGLYAAGATAANIAARQGVAGYSSGVCIGESTFFGRCAGRHVALPR